MECSLWYLDGSKRGYYRVNYFQKSTQKCLTLYQNPRKTPGTDSASPSAPPMYPLLSELPGLDAFSLPTFLPPPWSPFFSKGGLKNNKIRKDYNSLRRNLLQGELNHLQCLPIHPGAKQNLEP